MSASLVVTTLNVEGHKHLQRISSFLAREKPQVLCLQEVFKADLPRLAASLGTDVAVQFVPTLIVDRPNRFQFAPLGAYGIAMLSTLPQKNIGSAYYFGKAESIPLINDSDPNTPNRAVMWADIMTGAGPVRVANTHFTWSPNGQVCAAQTETLAVLLRIFQEKIQAGLLCGDFNAPRGGEIYQTLSTAFTDNVPPEIKTTLDNLHHRVPGIEYVVDYLFTTVGYVVDQVTFHQGLSDHQALSAQVTRL